MEFSVESEKVAEKTHVIALAGEADLYSAPELKKELYEAIDGGAKEVLVDLTQTTFIDSTTLGVLVGGVKRLRPNGGRLTVVCSDPNITKIFEITGLDRVFPIYPTRAEALEQVDSAGSPE